jgi:hypothetical protein
MIANAYLSTYLADALQVKLLKQAFTAISFGARKSGKGWMDSNGKWTNPAIVDIFRVKAERDLFLADPMVCDFIAELGKQCWQIFMTPSLFGGNSGWIYGMKSSCVCKNELTTTTGI